jgi:NifU-like protein involved in Fe-S cluster formation
MNKTKKSVGSPACGDVMKLQFEVDKTGKIVDAKFKTFGCGSAIAASCKTALFDACNKISSC